MKASGILHLILKPTLVLSLFFISLAALSDQTLTSTLNLPSAEDAEQFALQTVQEYKEKYDGLDRSLQPPLLIYHISDESNDLPDQIKWILVYLESHKIPFQVNLTSADEIGAELEKSLHESTERIQLTYQPSENAIQERVSALRRSMTQLRRFFWIPKNVTFWLKAHPPRWWAYLRETKLGKKLSENINSEKVDLDEKLQLPIWTDAKLPAQDQSKLKLYVNATATTAMFNVYMSIAHNPDPFLAHPSTESWALGLFLVAARTYFTSTHNLWFDKIFTLGKTVKLTGNGEVFKNLKQGNLQAVKKEFFKKTITVDSHWRWNWMANSIDNMVFYFLFFWTTYGLAVASDPIYFQHAAENTLLYLLGRSWIDRKIVEKQTTVHHNGDVEQKPGQHSVGFTFFYKYMSKSIFGFLKTFDVMRPKDGNYTTPDGTQSNYKLASDLYRVLGAIGFTKIIYDNRFWVGARFKAIQDWWHDVEPDATPTCTTYLIKPN